MIGPRYGPVIKDLIRAWLCLLESQAMTTAVFEEVDKGRAQSMLASAWACLCMTNSCAS